MPKIFYILILFLLFMIFGGCAPVLITSNEDLLEKKPDEGLVIGSFQVRLTNPYGDEVSGWWITSQNPAWYFTVNNIENDRVIDFILPNQFQLSAIAGGEETIFVAKLREGEYRIDELNKDENIVWEENNGKYFNVNAGQTTYIGRLVVVIPRYPGAAIRPDYAVESALFDVLPKLRSKYSNLGGNIKTELMRIDNSISDLKKYDKDSSIIKVIQKLYKRMGISAFMVWDFWGDDKKAIGIIHPQNYGVLIYISTFNTAENYYNVRNGLPLRRWG